MKISQRCVTTFHSLLNATATTSDTQWNSFLLFMLNILCVHFQPPRHSLTLQWIWKLNFTLRWFHVDENWELNATNDEKKRRKYQNNNVDGVKNSLFILCWFSSCNNNSNGANILNVYICLTLVIYSAKAFSDYYQTTTVEWERTSSSEWDLCTRRSLCSL